MRDNNYELYSVTKSVTSLLVGILNGEGKLGPNDKVVPGIVAAHPELKDALADKQDLKVRDLLSMSSGLFYKQTEGSDTLYYGVPNRLSVAAKSQAKLPPGKEFDYTDVNPVLVGAMVSAAARQREQKFAEEKAVQAARDVALPLGWHRSDRLCVGRMGTQTASDRYGQARDAATQ
ncbi:serine hydrolase domain-containing protein [Undibacterium arcticum]